MTSIVLAVILDFMVGDPYWFPHPVRLIGLYVKSFEGAVRSIVKSPLGLKIAGVLLLITTVAFAYFIPYYLLKIAFGLNYYLYMAMNVLVMYTCLAANCLSKEAKKIYHQLKEGNMVLARKWTSYIVGRDTDQLDEKEITRAVVETVSENSSDGVIAPLFYMILGGAPLGLAYKAVNTLDSMVGYKNDKYMDFGWASARFDDIANYIPSRLTGLLMSVASIFLGLDAKGSLTTMISDGRNHSSPNSGYPEAATAGALGIQLGGTNMYFGKPVYKPTIGTEKKTLDKEAIKKTIQLMYGAYFIALFVYISITIFSR